jgi:N-glycosylase/DNA lyase
MSVKATMDALVRDIEKLKKSGISKTIGKRISEFKARKSDNELFSELCFCILTANYNAEGGIRIQKEIGNGFFSLSEKRLAWKLKQLGHRFPNMRAEYIAEARSKKDLLISKIREEAELRNWVADNIKGLGYKEASHLLRNIGFDDYAIVDFHIIDLLEKYRIIERPKTLTHRKYMEIENVLKKIAEKTKLTLAELDLYLWYMETGTVLK